MPEELKNSKHYKVFNRCAEGILKFVLNVICMDLFSSMRK